MNTVNIHTLNLIGTYLSSRYEDFQEFLDLMDIEPSEAEAIISDLANVMKSDPGLPVIDRKFLISAINPINGKQYDSRNAILFCAKDRALPVALTAYRAECERLGSNREHILGLDQLIKRVEDFHRLYECRVPDTVGAEIPRCLLGVGV